MGTLMDISDHYGVIFLDQGLSYDSGKKRPSQKKGGSLHCTVIAAVNPVINAPQSALTELAQVQILLWQPQVLAGVKLGRLSLCCVLQCSSWASHSTQVHWLKAV